jgi:SAM-dependent methyltransferase
MLPRAHDRLGSCVARGDACCLPMRSGSIGQAVAVWVVHSVSDPTRMLREIARVLVPGGRLLVCPVNRAAPDDVAGQAFENMARRVERITEGSERAAVTAESVLWAGLEVGFAGQIEQLPPQRWPSTTEREIQAIVARSWSALVPLSDRQFAAVTTEALEMLQSLPSGSLQRKALAEVVALDRP